MLCRIVQYRTVPVRHSYFVCYQSVLCNSSGLFSLCHGCGGAVAVVVVVVFSLLYLVMIIIFACMLRERSGLFPFYCFSNWGWNWLLDYGAGIVMIP